MERLTLAELRRLLRLLADEPDPMAERLAKHGFPRNAPILLLRKMRERHPEGWVVL